MIVETNQDRWLTLAKTQIPMQLIAEFTRRPGGAAADPQHSP